MDRDPRSGWQVELMARRSYGSGRLYSRADSGGQESWYGSWYAQGRRVKRKIGPKRQPGSRDGLTTAQAEREMRRRIELERPVIRSRLTVGETGRRYLEHLEHVLERKPSTLGGYRSMLGRHVEPFFGGLTLERVKPDDVRRFLAAKKREGLGTKTVTNCLVFMHGLFASRSSANGCSPTRSSPSTGLALRPPTPIFATSTWRKWRRCCVPCPTTTSGRPSTPST